MPLLIAEVWGFLLTSIVLDRSSIVKKKGSARAKDITPLSGTESHEHRCCRGVHWHDLSPLACRVLASLDLDNLVAYKPRFQSPATDRSNRRRSGRATQHASQATTRWTDGATEA